MNVINNEDVRVTLPRCTSKMRIIGREIRMVMFDDLRVLRGPHQQRSSDADKGNGRKHKRREGQARGLAQPARQWISQEPAGVGQGKLGGE